MLKKTIAAALALCIFLCLAACGRETASEETAPAETSASQSAPTETPRPTPIPETALEYHTLEKIQQRGTLRVALQSGNSKMSYRVPEGVEEYADRAGQPSGYVPFICQQLAEDLGVELEYVFYDVAEEQLVAAEKGEADFSANVWSITDERLELYTMTDNILVTDIEGDEVFLRTDPQDPTKPLIGSEEELSTARIAAVKATVQETNAGLQYPEAEVLGYADNEAVLEALLSGEADAAVFTTFDKAFADILVQAIIDRQICQCEYDIVNPEIKGVGFILMKGNEDLCSYINQQLTRYRDEGLLLELNDRNETEARAMGII